MLRKLILTFPVLLLLGGCAGMAETAIGLPSGILTSSVQNPITKDTLSRVESGMRVAVAGLQTYKNYCETRPVGDQCDAIVAQLQGYSSRARPLIAQLRTFVRRNDQINARVVFSTLRGLFSDFQAYAAQNGVSVASIGVQ